MKQISPEYIEITRDERARIAVVAAENAKALGFTDREWKKSRAEMVPILADILVAIAPELPSPPADPVPAFYRPLGMYRIDRLTTELLDGRRDGGVARLRRLLEELAYRRSRVAVRLKARARLALMALERPEALPFLVAG